VTLLLYFAFVVIGLVVAARLGAWLLGVRYIPHTKVGIVEKLWASKGSLTEGRIIAFNGEAGYQTEILRGGIHAFYYPWQYRIHREPLVSIPEGKIGYVYSRDGQPLAPVQTLGRVVSCNNFQDARAFLAAGGQRGRQRAILREGVYAINLALFVVVAEDRVYQGPVPEKNPAIYAGWQAQLRALEGFDPVIVGTGSGADHQEDHRPIADQAGAPLRDDNIAVVTVHDGPPIESGEVIAPEVHAESGRADHDCFQDPEALLALGGRRGKQLQVLTDGTYFVNRWFATVEFKPKTVIPIGYVGVVVSYYGHLGEDLTGDQFRYGEQVERGRRGVWRKPLPPGKYPLNPFALKVELVPTVNFVLRWITGMVEEHQYDKDLSSIALITADGYEPLLPLSLVLHIDYEMAPRVVQRFGDVKRLISQTLDPIISAYFRDVAQTTQMLDLLTRREEIQNRATSELGRRFRDYDITCVAVLIGRPESQLDSAHKGQDPIQGLFDQLRQRRLANEQVETYARQQEAATKQRELNEARATADKQTELTQTHVDISIAGNRGEAQLAEARRLAERDVARAEGESRSRELLGRGEASRIAQTGVAEAGVFLKKIHAYGDPRLFALNLLSEQMARSQQPLVPQRVLMMGGDGNGGPEAGMSLFGKLLALLLAEKGGLDLAGQAGETKNLEQFVDALTGSVDPAGAGATSAGAAAAPAGRNTDTAAQG
jgi:uncharacterized membrane protein YqiK